MVSADSLAVAQSNSKSSSWIYKLWSHVCDKGRVNRVYYEVSESGYLLL